MPNGDDSTNWRRRYVVPYLRRFIRGWCIAGSAWLAGCVTLLPIGVCLSLGQQSSDHVRLVTFPISLAITALYATLAGPVVFDASYRLIQRHAYRTWMRQTRRKLKRYGHTTRTSSTKP